MKVCDQVESYNFFVAENLYKCGIKFDGENPYLLNNYACLLIRRKKFDEAKNYFLKGLQSENPHPIFYRNYGIFLNKTGLFQEAKNYFGMYVQKARFQILISIRYERLKQEANSISFNESLNDSRHGCWSYPST